MSEKFIKSIIILQNNFLLKKNIIDKYNLEYTNLENLILKIIDSIELNFNLNLIDLEFYNKNFELIDNYLLKLNELPNELNIKNYSLDYQIKLYLIRDNIKKLMMDCGVSKIYDIIYFFDEKFVLKDDELDFLNEILIPIKFNIKKSNNKSKNLRLLDLSNNLKDKVSAIRIEILLNKNILIIDGYTKKDSLNLYKKKKFFKKEN